MRVFITGASGHIASAVIPELQRHHHEVVGLARSDNAAAAVSALGAEVCRGDLDDLALLRDTAAACDGVIHLAFKHEAMHSGDFTGAIESDLAAIRAMGETLAGTHKPFVTTGGTLMLAMGGVTGRAGTEEDRVTSGPRVDAENYTLALANEGVCSSLVRLAPLVHSDLDHHGFTSTLIDQAREHGVAAYVGDGANRWPAANTYDIGVLYRLALETAEPGTVAHGAGDVGIPFKVIAETIAERLGVPTRSVTQDESFEFLGFLALFAGLDNLVSTELTRQRLGWEPTHPGWIDDVRTGHYGG